MKATVRTFNLQEFKVSCPQYCPICVVSLEEQPQYIKFLTFTHSWTESFTPGISAHATIGLVSSSSILIIFYIFLKSSPQFLASTFHCVLSFFFFLG